jgi:Flp pilus assembly protein TadG
MMWRKPTRRGRDEGAVAVETAIILSALVLLLLGIIEFTVAFYQFNTMLLAVSQAGRYVMLSYAATTPPPTACDTSCAQTRMQGILTGAAVCTTPTANQTCVNASLTTIGSGASTTNGMTLTARYGVEFFGFTGPITISSALWVPLD